MIDLVDGDWWQPLVVLFKNSSPTLISFLSICRFFLVIASLVLTVLSTVETRDKNYEQILQTPILAVVSVANCREIYFWVLLKVNSISILQTGWEKLVSKLGCTRMNVKFQTFTCTRQWCFIPLVNMWLLLKILTVPKFMSPLRRFL